MKLLRLSALSLFGALAILAADATGTWNISFETPNGKRETTMDLKQDGEKLTGTMHSQQGGDSPVTGTAKGDTLTFSITRDFQGQSFKMEYTGKVEGNKISGNVKLGDFGDAPFTGEKK